MDERQEGGGEGNKKKEDEESPVNYQNKIIELTRTRMFTERTKKVGKPEAKKYGTHPPKD